MTSANKTKANQEAFFKMLNERDFVPQLSVDCVIFGYHDYKLKVLLLQALEVDMWSVPGGYVYQNENVNDAAKRLLKERTQLLDVYLRQFYTFGDVDRTKNSVHKIMFQAMNIDLDANHWIWNRFISVGYFSLIDDTKVTVSVDEYNNKIQWFSIDQLPTLVFDHQEIIDKALEYLRNNFEVLEFCPPLLPAEFTLKELQLLHEGILGKELKRNNFQRKILGEEILTKVGKLFDGSPNKAPFLYRFKTKEDMIQDTVKS